ncbi:protein Niban 1-like [Diretmus argenteus]
MAHGGTQNQNECLNSMIWARCQKTTFQGLACVQAAAGVAVAIFNEGAHALCGVMDRLWLDTSQHTIEHMTAVDEVRVRKAEGVADATAKQTRRERGNAEKDYNPSTLSIQPAPRIHFPASSRLRLILRLFLNTMEYNKERISFLDALVYKDGDSFQTDLYRKPTDRNTMLVAVEVEPRPEPAVRFVLNEAVKIVNLIKARALNASIRNPMPSPKLAYLADIFECMNALNASLQGQAEAELKEFSPYYRKQFSVAHFSQVEDELEQHKEKITQLLKQREAPEVGEVLYEEGVLYFDDTRKWRERYVVVRANYCLECHDSLESFVKGVPPRHKLLPTGGAVLTTEEKYMAAVDKCFPDDTNNVKEEFAPSLSGMPGQFPVYLRLPYRRDSYFCFRQEAKQAGFLSILSDCIRHQNQDFLKKKTCEVQAFLKAIRLYREEKGRYEAWDMLIGSDVRVMANLVMEQLLPCLEKDMLPRLKAKKTERKRVWFATVEAAYILVQEHLFEGLSALKAECRTLTRQQEVLIHSDMDQIVNSRRLVEDKLRGNALQIERSGFYCPAGGKSHRVWPGPTSSETQHKYHVQRCMSSILRDSTVMAKDIF